MTIYNIICRVDIYNFIAVGSDESLYKELVFLLAAYLKQYRQVALGGTFDILHKGHLELLRKSFEIGLFVTIGVTSDEFVREKLNKQIRNPHSVRVQNLRNFLQKNIKSSNYEITKLNDSFGPLMISGSIDCLVVSSETEEKGRTVNHLRAGLGLPAIEVVLVKLVLAEDGIPISSTRIRSNEIDENGFKTNK